MPVVAIVNQTHGKRRRDLDHNENRLHHATIQANIEPSTIATTRKQNMPDNAVNAVNRGVYISDNLPFLQSLNDECIDLVCIDPPFAKNETFGRQNDKSPDPLKPPLTEQEHEIELTLLRRWGIRNEDEANAAGIDWPATRYKDFWSWADVHEQWLKDIEDDHPNVHKLIDATQEIHGDGTAAYLCYMAVRLFEIRRVLKNTGNIYLHCDHTAGAYLRQLMDAIFGKENFLNEIVWKRTGSHGNAKRWGPIHDTIILYSKSPLYHWNNVFTDYDETYLDKYYRFQDQRGRYRLVTLTGAGTRAGASGHPWRGIDPNESTRHWAIPISALQAAYPDVDLSGLTTQEKLEMLDEAGLIYWPKNGKIPQQKRYTHEAPGTKIQDIIHDIPPISPQANERIGYPTQKPVALAQRIIEASCPEDGVVLDCFAGCAYVAIAAERLGRNWVTCDINPRAWTVFKRQFAKPTLALLTCSETTHLTQPALMGSVVTVHGPGELPIRQTPDHDNAVPGFNVAAKPRVFKTPASIIPETEMLELLLELSHYQAWCCGFANRKPNGEVIKTTRNFHLDHLNPVSKAGTSHQIINRAPLCPYHNLKKSNHRFHLAEYRQQIADAGEMMVDDASHLIDLDFAFDRAINIYSARQTQKQITT